VIDPRLFDFTFASGSAANSAARSEPTPALPAASHRDGNQREFLGEESRSRFFENLEAIISRGDSGALLVIDVDRFHRINEGYGHVAGDRLLGEVAGRLRTSLRRADGVAQLGGDEFAVLVRDVQCPNGAAIIARKLLDALRRPVTIEGETVAITASIGIALFPLHSNDMRALLRAAYAAMRDAKRQGVDRLCVFGPYAAGAAAAQADLERDLHHAVRNGEIELHFQPIHNLVTGRVEALEALARWRHPQLGLLEPDRFIPLAEEIGLACAVGEHVLDSACHALAHWHASGFRDLRVSVNLSARDFERADLVETVEATLQRHAIAPASLEVEITEHALIEGPHAAEHVNRLDRSGVQVSLDDFGVKYSSLGRLHRLPVRTLKVDRSFVREVGSSTASDSIVSAVAGIARSMGLRLIAEGVEEVEQVHGLMRLGCHLMQGFLFSPPLPIADVDRYLARAALGTVSA